MQKGSVQRAILGAAVGVGIGIVIVTLFVILTTAWMLLLGLPIAILFFAIVGGFVGFRFGRDEPPVARFGLLLVLAIALWPLCALGPLWAREFQIRHRIARDIPIHPASTLVKSEVRTYGFDDNPGYALEWRCSEPVDQAIAFYRKEFAAAGWTALPSVRRGDYVYHQFRRSNALLTLVGFVSWHHESPVNEVRLWCNLSNFTYDCKSLAELGNKVVSDDPT